MGGESNLCFCSAKSPGNVATNLASYLSRQTKDTLKPRENTVYISFNICIYDTAMLVNSFLKVKSTLDYLP